MLYLQQVTLAEEFKFDHDLSFLVEYKNCYAPQVIVEAGNPEAGMLQFLLYLCQHTNCKWKAICANKFS